MPDISFTSNNDGQKIGVLIAILVIIHLFFPIISGIIAHDKGHSGVGFFLLDLVLPVIGFIAAICAADLTKNKVENNYYIDKNTNNQENKDWVCDCCGRKNNEGKFCVYCGTKRKVESWSCKNCGTVNEENSLYCKNCGEKHS